jgi:YVTN family beta-propeller protein
MRTSRDSHFIAGHHGGVGARRSRAGVAAAALALPLAASGIAAAPASAGGYASAACGYHVTRTITVGSGPDGVAVDAAARTVYVANDGSGTVSVINEATGTVTATVPVGSFPDAVAVDAAARTVYVANDGSGTVSVIQMRGWCHPHR